MEKARKQYDEEFKKRAVQLSYDPARTVQSVVKSLGISQSMLYRWRAKYTVSGERTEASLVDEEKRQMRKQIKEMEEEIEILKKHRPTSRNTSAEQAPAVRVHANAKAVQSEVGQGIGGVLFWLLQLAEGRPKERGEASCLGRKGAQGLQGGERALWR